MEMDEGYEIMMEEEGCRTPRSDEVSTNLVCPPPPRKKKMVYGKKREAPKMGYFQPPDLEVVFSLPPARQRAFA
ncbi:hypothetical protein ACHQM5_020231 [Ranunculus cassubicifolius]